MTNHSRFGAGVTGSRQFPNTAVIFQWKCGER